MEIKPAITTTAPQITQATKEDAKMRKACQGFESMLVYQMLSKMRQSVQKSDLFGSGEQEDTFQGMMDQKLADHIAETRSMGIGDAIYNQMTHRYNSKT